MQSPATDGRPLELPPNEQATDAEFQRMLQRDQERRQEFEQFRQRVVLHAPPRIEMPYTPPPRRSSKRAQRARERHWSR